MRNPKPLCKKRLNFKTNADEFHLRELNFDARYLLLPFRDIATFTTNVNAVLFNTHEAHSLRGKWAHQDAISYYDDIQCTLTFTSAPIG